MTTKRVFTKRAGQGSSIRRPIRMSPARFITAQSRDGAPTKNTWRQSYRCSNPIAGFLNILEIDSAQSLLERNLRDGGERGGSQINKEINGGRELRFGISQSILWPLWRRYGWLKRSTNDRPDLARRPWASPSQ